MKSILFICKKNDCYGFVSYNNKSSGLYNSTRFIVDSLWEAGASATVVEVNDNNDIDREVTKYNPDIVVIEALWVVPEKFKVLQALHPDVEWCVHMHSGLPFLALEGIAIEWIRKYEQLNIRLIANSVETYEAFRMIFIDDQLVYLPNVYCGEMRKPIGHVAEREINIGCFGAIRPLKNQLVQAFAAIKFAKEKRQPLRFHINGSRVETGGEPVLKNLRHLFKEDLNAQLIEWPWYEPETFIDHLHARIDIGMQVSFTETFNVITADYITAGLPVVCSQQIDWVSCWNKTKDETIESMIEVLHIVHNRKHLVRRNQKKLVKFSDRAIKMWLDFIEGD